MLQGIPRRLPCVTSLMAYREFDVFLRQNLPFCLNSLYIFSNQLRLFWKKFIKDCFNFFPFCSSLKCVNKVIFLYVVIANSPGWLFSILNSNNPFLENSQIISKNAKIYNNTNRIIINKISICFQDPMLSHQQEPQRIVKLTSFYYATKSLNPHRFSTLWTTGAPKWGLCPQMSQLFWWAANPTWGPIERTTNTAVPQ